MKKLLSICLLSITLLTEAGCSSKKEDVTPAPIVSGGYKVDGTARTCSMVVVRHDTVNPRSLNQEYLAFSVVADGNPYREQATVFYRKPLGASDSQYRISTMYLDAQTGSPGAGQYITNTGGTVSKTVAGKWSGTFSATKSGHVITDGFFNEVTP